MKGEYAHVPGVGQEERRTAEHRVVHHTGGPQVGHRIPAEGLRKVVRICREQRDVTRERY